MSRRHLGFALWGGLLGIHGPSRFPFVSWVVSVGNIVQGKKYTWGTLPRLVAEQRPNGPVLPGPANLVSPAAVAAWMETLGVLALPGLWCVA